MANQIYELLPKVAAEIGFIGKGQRNPQKNYAFRGIEDALSACGPAMQKHGVCMTTEVKDWKCEGSDRKRGDSMQTVYRAMLLLAVTFWAPDGSSCTSTMAGEALDYNDDKATNKAMAAAFKYALFFSLCIPVDGRAIEDSDRESVEHEAVPKQKPMKRASAKEKLPQPRIEPEPSNMPGDEVDPTLKAATAINNAPDKATLTRYLKKVVEKQIAGEYTVEQADYLGKVVERRKKELSYSLEPIAT